MAISKVIYKTSPQDTGTVWMDATPATATAADILAPKTAMLADGVLTTGTGSGGGGGLEYETGTFTPTGDVATVEITFANSHTVAPLFVLVADETTVALAGNAAVAMINYNAFLEAPLTSNSNRYATKVYISVNSDGAGFSLGTSNANTVANLNNFVTNTTFYAATDGTRLWRTGKTYKWIAVWSPTV